MSPSIRDLAWKDLYNRYHGRIDEQFAFTAFRTAPLVSASAMDAKVVTADMASRLMVWAALGKPNQREWTPGSSSYAKNDGPISLRLLPVPWRGPWFVVARGAGCHRSRGFSASRESGR
jgi:hypothetical protein